VLWSAFLEYFAVPLRLPPTSGKQRFDGFLNGIGREESRVLCLELSAFRGEISPQKMWTNTRLVKEACLRGGGFGGGRDEYRKAQPAPGEFNPTFGGGGGTGFGRGAVPAE